MKLNKFFLGLFCASALLTACSDDDDYQWAQVTGGNQVYFSNTLPSSINLSKDESTFSIPVSRVDSSAAASYSISLNANELFLTAPASVSFAAGQAVADLTLTYNPDTLAYDLFQSATLTITDEANTNDYGYKSYTFRAGIPSPFISIGKGTFTDNFWFEGSATVEFMQNSENPNVFRIMAPFDALADEIWAEEGGAAENLDGNQAEYIELTILKPGDTFYKVSITQEDLVGYTDINTGYFHSTYSADVNMLFPGRLTNYAAEEFFVHNRVVEWQENGLPGRIQLAPYYYMFGVGGWDNTQADDVVVIDFPGYDPKDYSVEMETLGVLTDQAGNPSVALNATFGEDASDVRAVVISEDADVDATIAAVEKGEMEYTTIGAGYNFVPVPEGLTGKLTLLVMVFDEGAAQEAYEVDFEYWGGGANPWEAKGTGDFIYTLMFSNDDGSPYTDEGLELQYNAEDDVYRITHWGYDVDFSFKWDQATNQVNVPSQFSGYTHSNYGQVFVQESDDYVAANGAWDDDDDGNPDPNDGPSYYDPETQTFHFNLCYFVSAGYFGHGEETYTLSAAEARRVQKMQMPAANGSLKATKHQWKKSLGLPVNMKLAD